jgi:hypothetical protein
MTAEETMMILEAATMVVWESMANVLVALGCVKKVMTKKTGSQGMDLLIHQPLADG